MRTTRTFAAAILAAAALATPAQAKPSIEGSTQLTPVTLSPSDKATASLFTTAVKFRNSYHRPVTVAIMRYDPDSCGGEYGNWQTKGWWRLEPGQVKQAFSTSNRYAYFYARANDGTEWRGTSKRVDVYRSAFDSCVDIGSTGADRSVRMQRIDVRGGSGVRLTHTVSIRG